MKWQAIALLAALLPAHGQVLAPFTVVGDSVPSRLTGDAGDPGRGRALVANRQVGLCLLCHTAPIPEERFQG
nr:sulfur oxidation c-type cytochrome SoxX [Pseudomonadota bacterium]